MGNNSRLTPDPDGVLHATSLEVWVLGATDILVANGTATFTPIPGEPPGYFQDLLTLTIAGGTGRFAGATGTIQVHGQGYNVFAGPGNGYFDVAYKGSVCGVKD